MDNYCGNCGWIDESEPAHCVEHGTCTKTGKQEGLGNPGCEGWKEQDNE